MSNLRTELAAENSSHQKALEETKAQLSGSEDKLRDARAEMERISQTLQKKEEVRICNITIILYR